MKQDNEEDELHIQRMKAKWEKLKKEIAEGTGDGDDDGQDDEDGLDQLDEEPVKYTQSNEVLAQEEDDSSLDENQNTEPIALD